MRIMQTPMALRPAFGYEPRRFWSHEFACVSLERLIGACSFESNPRGYAGGRRPVTSETMKRTRKTKKRIFAM